MSSSSLVLFLGNLGLVGACVLFLSPIPTMMRIRRSQSTLFFSPDPYIFSLINCVFWTLYALPSVTPDRTSPLITNCIGAVINLAYIVVFANNNPPETFWSKVWAMAGTIAFVFSVIFFFAPSHASWFGLPSETSTAEIESNLLGTLSDVFNIMMYGGPLTIMSTVIRTKSVEFMPLPLTVGTSLCSFTWLAYGTVVGDKFIIIPNGGGAVFCVAQIILYCTYCGTEESRAAFERVRLEKEKFGGADGGRSEEEQQQRREATTLLYGGA